MRQERQKIIFAGSGKHRRQAGEHVAEVDPGIMAVTLARGQQTEMDRRRAAAAVAPTKQPVAASNAEAANRILAFVVVGCRRNR